MGNVGAQELLLVVILGGILVAGIFYLITLQNALKAVSPKNRKMEPGTVWVMLVPLLNTVFIFFIVEAIGASFKREYERYGVIKMNKPTFYLGLAMAICFISGYFFGIAYLAGLTCWIFHWINVNQYKNEILSLKGGIEADANEPSIFN
jgi:hypothetical protein